jgi:hypothetical protein
MQCQYGSTVSRRERPLVAESGPSILWILGYLNDRFGEKRTFRNIPKIFTKLTNLERPLYAQKRTFGRSYRWHLAVRGGPSLQASSSAGGLKSVHGNHYEE